MDPIGNPSLRGPVAGPLRHGPAAVDRTPEDMGGLCGGAFAPTEPAGRSAGRPLNSAAGRFAGSAAVEAMRMRG